MSGTSTWITQWECPQSDNRHLHPHNVNFVQCNEMRHNLRCNAAFLLKSGAFAPASSPAALGLPKWCQVLGLAASIAAFLTIWPISLACSPSERICACTYSLRSPIPPDKSLPPTT